MLCNETLSQKERWEARREGGMRGQRKIQEKNHSVGIKALTRQQNLLASWTSQPSEP